MAPVIGRAVLIAGLVGFAATAGGAGRAAARLLQGRRGPDPPEQQRRRHAPHHRPDDQPGGRRHQGLPARAQPDHASRRALLLLRERAGQHGGRLRHEDAPARAADRPVGRPNKIVVNKKQRKIYVGIRSRRLPTRPLVDVIDIATHKVVRSVPVHLPVHNTYVTPDDKFVVAGLRGETSPASRPSR